MLNKILFAFACVLFQLVSLIPCADEDPHSLDETVRYVANMRLAGSSNQEIAQYVSRVVDRRLSSTNRISFSGGDTYGLFIPGPAEIAGGNRSEWSRRFDRYDRERESFGKPQDEITRSDLTERAIWSWANRVGNCNETQAITYYILSNAGIPARTIASNARSGHDFVVIGFAHGFDPAVPSSWGPDAYVVDGWTGDALSAQESYESSYHHDRGRATLTDRTAIIVRPDQDRRWKELEGKGILFVQIVDKKTKKGLDGVSVRASAPGINETQTASNGGKVTFVLSAVGAVSIHAASPSEDYQTVRSSTEIRERRRVEVTLPLERIQEISQPPPARAVQSLKGQGTVSYAAQAWGDVRIINNKGSLTLTLTVDLENESVSGELKGSFSATLVGEDFRQEISTVLSGSIAGGYSGNVHSGQFRGGTAKATQSGFGGTVRGSGNFSGGVSNGQARCDVTLAGESFKFRFPVRAE